jgi:hypothetical protein
MRSPLTATVLALLTLTAAACGEEADPADADSARTGWRSTEAALGQAGVSAMWSGSVQVDESGGVSGMLDGTVSCPDGGSLQLQSSADVSETHVVASLDVEFDDCRADGVVTNGSLQYAADVTETSATASISGDLVWSGAAEGACDVDISASASADGASATGSVSGSMCGFGYAELFGG